MGTISVKNLTDERIKIEAWTGGKRTLVGVWILSPYEQGSEKQFDNNQTFEFYVTSSSGTQLVYVPSPGSSRDKLGWNGKTLTHI